jgi:ubiquinone/menaquinone biosynthesis C-methylase UbiE
MPFYGVTNAANRYLCRRNIKTLYSPERYWNAVAERIKKRTSQELIAGDEEPYYQYKRNKFLKLLNLIPFEGKKVIEVGSGPGSNLLEVYQHNPKEIFGADISEQMIDISRKTAEQKNITIIKTDGRQLLFPDNRFELAFTSTVLQHITDEQMLAELIKEICRITETDIYIFERIEKKNKKSKSNTGRTIDEYAGLFKQYSFVVVEVKFLHIHWSYLTCGAIRKIFNSKKRKEGEPSTKVSVFLQNCALILTKRLDTIFKVKRDMAMLYFKRQKS